MSKLPSISFNLNKFSFKVGDEASKPNGSENKTGYGLLGCFLCFNLTKDDIKPCPLNLKHNSSTACCLNG